MTTRQGRDSGSSTVANGLVLFAVVTLALTGVLQVLEGLVALFDDTFYVAGLNYTYEFDITAWGWIHLLVGILALVAAFGLMSGAVWGRILGITFACISVDTNFAWLPYYPLWAIVVITLNIIVIWAITRYDMAD